MRKTSILFVLSFFFLFSGFCKASMTVSPIEVSIIMEDSFISGNTSKKISVRNNEDANINVSWYVEDPDPISLMRPNRSCIPDLSWVSVKPNLSIIPPGNSSFFYIFLDVPELDEYRGQHWETWVTFRVLPTPSINVESAVRVYIDTPPAIQRDSSLLFVFIALIIVLSISVFLILYLKILKR